MTTSQDDIAEAYPSKADATGNPPRQRGAKALMAALTTGQVLALARNVLLARLLGPEQFGLAMTLVLTMQFFDSISDSGNDKFLIQDQEGDSPTVQHMAHFTAIGRGLLLAAGLALLADPLADFYRAPQMTAAFMLLGMVPLVTGLLHLDIRRLQRRRNFIPESRAILWSESMSFIITVAAAIIIKNYFAILIGLIARSAVMMIVSHLTAERKYRAAYSTEHAPRFWAFSWPLLINGPLLFFSGQSDRLLIGNQLGVTELGLYSAALLLIFSPSAMLSRFLGSLYMPFMAARKSDPKALNDAEAEFHSVIMLVALAMATGFALVGPFAVHFLYGSKFAQPAQLIAAIGLLQSARFLRTWPSYLLWAVGRSKLILASNIIRLILMPTGILAAIYWQSLFALTIGFFVGEIIALALSVVVNNRALGRPPLTRLFGIFIMVVNAGMIIAVIEVFTSDWPKTTTLVAAVLTSLFFLCLIIERQLLRSSLVLFRRIRTRIIR